MNSYFKFLLLLLLAAIAGGLFKIVNTLGTADSRVSAPQEFKIPPSDPLIEPKENAGRCLATAKIVLPKQYDAFANHSRFTGAKRLTDQTWQIRGELSEYSAAGVKVFVFECLDDKDSTGVEIHPK